MGTPGSAVNQNYDIIDDLQSVFPDEITVEETKGDYPSVRFPREQVRPVLNHLFEERNYRMLSDLAGADFPDREPRLEVIYNVYNIEEGNRLLLHTGVPEDDPTIDSVTTIWKAARWYEREVYDMYGVTFREHPQHKRILLYEEFEGHPLRKDYPMKKRQPLPMYYEKDQEQTEPDKSSSSPDAPSPESPERNTPEE